MQDEHAGDGGSFRLGSEGKRALVQRTGPEVRGEPQAPAEVVAAGPVEVDAALSPAPSKPGKSDKAKGETSE